MTDTFERVIMRVLDLTAARLEYIGCPRGHEFNIGDGSMTVSLRERRRQMLYDEILTAVGSLLEEKGYSAMSMDELAARVGISKPTLYSFFPTKEDLVVEAVVHGMDRVAAVIQADQTARSPLERLIFILRTVIEMQIKKGALTPRPWSPEVIQLVCTREEVLGRMRSNEARLVDLIQRSIASGELNPALDPVLILRAFFAILNALHLPFLGGMGAPNPDTVADTLVTIFERGVRAPER
ncbi:MAG TPA: TetR/AcrR family transcriptional regulator [Roseiflexaceae bacterium]|nr:TetR/AcrR family transcriptional regulator [Roseiflexaceae bacterium]